MNKKQRKLVACWIISFLLVIAVFVVMYFFDEPRPIIIFIIAIFYSITGKTYKELRENRKDSFQEFTEYAENHKRTFIWIALFHAILPIIIYILVIRGDIELSTDPGDLIVLALILMVPFFIFDTGHRIYVYEKHRDDT